MVRRLAPRQYEWALGEPGRQATADHLAAKGTGASDEATQHEVG
jgi:hypothetical protein